MRHNVHVESLLDHVIGDVQERLSADDPRVVDQNIHGADFRLDQIRIFVNVFPVSDVHDVRINFKAFRLDPLLHAF